MPDLEISNLPALAEAGVQATDPVAVADLSASETKKVTVKDLVAAGVALIDDADIPAAKVATPFAANAVATATIQDLAVTAAKIANTTITASQIANTTITAAKIVNDTITATQIAADAIGASELADDAVDTAAIVNNAVTTAKITDANVTYAKLNLSNGDIPGAKIATGGITATQLATNSVTASELADDAVDTAAIANAAVTAAKIATDTITAANIAANAVGASELADNAVDTAAIADGAVTAAKLSAAIVSASIADDAVTTAKIADDAVTSAKLAANAVDATALADNAVDTAAIANTAVTGAKIATDTITATQIAANAVTASELADDAVDTAAILDDAVTGAKIAATTITGANIAATTIAAGNIVGNTITAAQIAADAVGASELADDAVDTAAIADLAVTNAKIANTTVSYAKLNISNGDIPGAKLTDNSVTATQIAADAVGASELANDAVDTAAIADGAVTAVKIANTTITAAQLASNAVTTAKITDANVTYAKLSLSNGDIPGAKITDDSITATQIAANAITASELANNSVDTDAIIDANVTNAKLASNAVTNVKITDGTITAAKLNTSNIDRSLNVASGNLGINNVVTAATRSGISYNAQGLITGTVALAAADLPVATTSAVGGVSIGTGLSVSGAGALSLTNSVTGATISGITFNNQGMITAATALVATDIPVATTSARGAVIVPSGGALAVDGSGNLSLGNSGVSAGTHTKVTVDAKGIVTTGASLAAGDIPSLSAAKITSGSLDAARIGAATIDGTKLSNASTTIFQSIAQSGYPTAQFNGQICFDTVSEDAFIWDGTAWQAITTLTKGSLVFGGTYNANTSKMVSTTSAGIAAGLVVGSNLPTASATTDGVYVVVSTSGTPSSPAPVVALAPPDYVLGVTNSSGSSWNEIDLSQTVAGQVASNITFTPYGQLSSTNVQDAIQELETEKLALAGGTVTGEILIGHTGSLVFEGATADAYELTLAVADPTTSDKTITLPDVTGTVVTTGDTGSVTGTMLANDTIQNTDIKSDAAIAYSKLAALTSAQILVGNGSNVATGVAVTGDISISNAGLTAIAAGVIVDADISGSAAITGSKIATGTTSAVGVLQLTDSTSSTSATTAATPAAVKTAKDAADAAATTANAALPKAGGTLTGNLIIDNAKELRLSEADGDGAHFTGLKAQAQSADITLTLPATAPTTGQVLKSGSTATTLEWATDSATDSTKMPLAGGTFTGDVTFTGDSSNGLWDKSASAFVGNLTGNVTGNVTGNTSGSSGSCSGNAATATALATARNIGGVSFDGTAAIDLPGVNASGTQDTSGTAAVATAITVADESTDTSCNVLFTTAATGDLGAKSGTNLTFNSNTGLLTATAFAGALTGNVTGNASGSSGSCTGNAATATEATNITVTANNSTDETCYPLFADAATGTQGAESDSGLTYNPSTGVLTTTSVTGNLTGNITGNVTGNCTGTAATVTGAAQASITSLGTLTGLTVSGQTDFTGMLTEACTVTAGKLSDNANLDLSDGNVFLFTTAETTTSTPNLRWDGSTALNTKMGVGDALTVSIITTAAAAGFSAELTIDGSAVAENWVGGTAPAAGGASGVDIYTYTIIKTASAQYTVIGNLTKTSA